MIEHYIYAPFCKATCGVVDHFPSPQDRKNVDEERGKYEDASWHHRAWIDGTTENYILRAAQRINIGGSQ